jgi:pimeloyl-ACP methyl ester carboxylesterase
MTMKSCFFERDGVRLHALECGTAPADIPIIIIPGATTNAQEIADDFSAAFSHLHYVLDMRGKGQSDVPTTGYSVESLAADVWAFMQHKNIEKAVVFGYSVGTGIALELYSQHRDAIAGVVIGDYVPIYPPFSEAWAARAQEQNPHLSPTFFEATVRESELREYVPLLKTMTCPCLLVKGGKEGSLFPDEYIPLFEGSTPQGEVVVLADSDHDIFLPDPQVLADVLLRFMQKV